MIDLENDLSKNAKDTDMQNIVGVRQEAVDVITISSKDFKCTQCAFQKQARGAVESHMYELHGIGGFEYMFCDDFTTTNSHSLYVHCSRYHNINIKSLKLKI